MNYIKQLFTLFLASTLSSLPTALQAQAPSDNPQTGRILNVNPSHSAATDEGKGSENQPFLTINAAAEIAQPGDTVLVHKGIYREHVKPMKSGTSEQPITYAAAPDEQVIVKGSEIWNPEWNVLDPAKRIQEGKLDPEWFKDFNPYHTTISIGGGDRSKAARPSPEEEDLPETLGQVFVNSAPYIQVRNRKLLEEMDGSWLVNPAGDGLIINFKQNEILNSGNEIEISVRNRIFSPYRRGLNYIVVQGFIFEHCANQGPFPQGGAVSFRSGRNWTFINNTIRYAKTVGLDCGSEYWQGDKLNTPTAEEDQKQIFGGAHLIRKNVISDNGLAGIAGWNHQHTMVVENIIERNNRLNFPHTRGWEEWAGIKFHESNALIAGNIVRDNEGYGIWIDNGYRNCHIDRNVIVNNKLAGIFMELGGATKNRPLISNNIIGFTRSNGGFYAGNGIYTHDASDIDIFHNLFIGNAGFGVGFRYITGRKYGGKTAGAGNIRVLNNIFVGNNLGQISFPVSSELTANNFSDYNYYDVGWGGKGKTDFYINAFRTPVDWDAETSKLEEALTNQEVPPAQWPNLLAWRKFPAMTFPAWQAYWDMDHNSKRMTADEGKHFFSLRANIMELVYPEMPVLREMKCPALPNVNHDFNGNPIEGEFVIPGPFQDAGESRKVYSLNVNIQEPRIKATEAELERDRQIQILDEQTQNLKEAKSTDKPDQVFTLADVSKEGPWFLAKQSSVNPTFVSSYTPLTPLSKSTVELYTQGAKGPSRSGSRVLLFKAPATGWYTYDIDAALGRRAGASAGYTRAEIYILNEDFSAGKLLDSTGMNTADGYRGSYLPKDFTTAGQVALLEGWSIALRFQIVSPGPAPGGSGGLNVNSFSIQQFSPEE